MVYPNVVNVDLVVICVCEECSDFMRSNIRNESRIRSHLFSRPRYSYCRYKPHVKVTIISYSLRPILLFTNTDVSITKICLDTSILTKSIMGRREYHNLSVNHNFTNLRCKKIKSKVFTPLLGATFVTNNNMFYICTCLHLLQSQPIFSTLSRRLTRSFSVCDLF
jgi:hypothetical protein